jgi:hypothetical protein
MKKYGKTGHNGNKNCGVSPKIGIARRFSALCKYIFSKELAKKKASGSL